MIVLDTDTASFFHVGHPRVTSRMAELDASEVIAITVITQGEILRARFEYLFKASNGEQLRRAQQWLDRSVAFLREFIVLPVDGVAAAEFDRLRQHKKLTKIGRADLLIACISLAHDATLVTRNTRHFGLIPKLQLENWVD